MVTAYFCHVAQSYYSPAVHSPFQGSFHKKNN